MCGIAGIFFQGQGGANDTWCEQVVRQMLSSIQHRGRELPSVKGKEGVWLGCCRLPIVDRDNGNQPVSNESGTIIAVFNGEIYNYNELRTKLIKHKLSTNCDSELIPHLYEEESTLGCIQDLVNGMFAIAIYDKVKRQCTLLRDHIGKKPLYVLVSNEKKIVAFASEMKAFGVPLDKSIFGSDSEILELKPGERIVICEKGTRSTFSKPIWETPSGSIIADMSSAIKEIYEGLSEAVNRRLPSDILEPVAVLCSGGIDSLAVAWLANHIGANVTAYVIGTANSHDVRAAIEACNYLNISIRHVICDDVMVNSVVADVVHCTESFEPNIVRNSLISYLLFRKIRQDGYRIALCGEGADELFFGYADFENANKQKLRVELLNDLFRTQLLRVDRTSMAFNVEVRAPFLDREFIKLACRLKEDLNSTSIYGVWQGKATLRQAFLDKLPWENIVRNKATFSFGAGFGDVSMGVHEPLEQYAKKVLGAAEKGSLERRYTHLDLKTYERALYLYFYEQFYKVPGDTYIPPIVAKKEAGPV